MSAVEEKPTASIVLWCDSDPHVKGDFLESKGYHVVTFDSTAKVLKYVKSKTSSELTRICAVITSGMKRGGRAERGLMSGMAMLDNLVSQWEGVCSNKPVFAVITLTVSWDVCRESGVKIRVCYDSKKCPDPRRAVQQAVHGRLTEFDSKRREETRLCYREPMASCDEYRRLCYDFLVSVIGSRGESLLDPYANGCFCDTCEPLKIYWRGDPPKKYVLPTGYYRFGMRLRADLRTYRTRMEAWHVAYHGAPPERALSIMEHQRIMFPGDTLRDGTKLAMRHAACFAKSVASDGKVIYVSPSIKYCASYYAKVREWKDGWCGQIVFQCRVKPKSFKEFRSTLPGIWDKDSEPEIDDSTIEWVTADRTAVVPYAVLVRVWK